MSLEEQGESANLPGNPIKRRLPLAVNICPLRPVYARFSGKAVN